jgi:hypothetical protein
MVRQNIEGRPEQDTTIPISQKNVKEPIKSLPIVLTKPQDLIDKLLPQFGLTTTDLPPENEDLFSELNSQSCPADLIKKEELLFNINEHNVNIKKDKDNLLLHLLKEQREKREIFLLKEHNLNHATPFASRKPGGGGGNLTPSLGKQKFSLGGGQASFTQTYRAPFR